MSLQTLTDRIKDIVKEDSKLNSTVKFDTSEGVVFVDATQVPNIVNNEDKEAACKIKLSVENALKLLDGELNGMNAFMMGKIKVKGDMGVAMKVMQLIG
ncbi:MAG: SCP2 sterol-binding domain-containing protein [Thermonemataceae bacterium]